MSEAKDGIYKARAVAGSEQYGESTNGKPELLLDLSIPELNMRVTTALYFSAEAAPYSMERLRACGWEGDDIRNLKGVDKNEISVELKSEMYEGKARMKAQILSGGGRFTSAKPMERDRFAAAVTALTGQNVGGAGAKPKAPPF